MPLYSFIIASLSAFTTVTYITLYQYVDNKFDYSKQLVTVSWKHFGSNSDLFLSWTLFIIIRSHSNSPLSPTIFMVLSSLWTDGFFKREYFNLLSFSPFWIWLLVILVAKSLTPCRPFILVVWLFVAAILSKGWVEDNAHCFLTDRRPCAISFTLVRPMLPAIRAHDSGASFKCE